MSELRDERRRGAQREDLRAEAEDAVRRLVKGAGRRVAGHELQWAVSLEVAGESRRSEQNGGDCNENDP